MRRAAVASIVIQLGLNGSFFESCQAFGGRGVKAICELQPVVFQKQVDQVLLRPVIQAAMQVDLRVELWRFADL